MSYSRSPHSHYDVILIVTSFATELATPTITDIRTDTLLRLIYRDILQCCCITITTAFAKSLDTVNCTGHNRLLPNYNFQITTDVFRPLRVDRGRITQFKCCCFQILRMINHSSFVCSLLWAGVQPTLDPSTETIERSNELTHERGGESVGVCECVSDVQGEEG